jgi:hypothetical protein
LRMLEYVDLDRKIILDLLKSVVEPQLTVELRRPAVAESGF